MEIHKKIKIGIPEIGTVSAITSNDYGEFEAEILGYNEKKICAFIWYQKILLSVQPWGMRMQWEHPTLKKSKLEQ